MALILILFTVALLLPVTQTFLGHRMTSNLYARFGTTLNVDHIRISPFGYVILNDVTALDHKQDTLIHIGFARMNALRLQAVLQGDNNLGSVFIQNVDCNIITYKDEKESNIDLFFNRFDSEKTKMKKK